MFGNTRKFDHHSIGYFEFFSYRINLSRLLTTFVRRYYLKYQNRRVEYISAFWNVANFDNCVKLYDAARKQ
jgi:hypothetical protein